MSLRANAVGDAHVRARNGSSTYFVVSRCRGCVLLRWVLPGIPAEATDPEPDRQLDPYWVFGESPRFEAVDAVQPVRRRPIRTRAARAVCHPSVLSSPTSFRME